MSGRIAQFKSGWPVKPLIASFDQVVVASGSGIRCSASQSSERRGGCPGKKISPSASSAKASACIVTRRSSFPSSTVRIASGETPERNASASTLHSRARRDGSQCSGRKPNGSSAKNSFISFGIPPSWLGLGKVMMSAVMVSAHLSVCLYSIPETPPRATHTVEGQFAKWVGAILRFILSFVR